MRRVLINVLVLMLFSLGAASGQDNSLPPCSVSQLEEGEALLAEFDSLVFQAASVETINDLLDSGAAQLAWREATWQGVTYCSELFELALLINQVTESMLSGRLLGSAGVEEDANPYVEAGFTSARRLNALEVQIGKTAESRPESPPDDSGLSSCTLDQRRALAEEIHPVIQDLTDLSGAADTVEAALEFLKAQLAWRANIWSELPPCIEAYALALTAHDYFSNSGNIQVFDLAGIPQNYNPYKDSYYDKLFQLSDFHQWLEVTGWDYSSLPRCSETVIDAELYQVIGQHLEFTNRSIEDSEDLSEYARAHIRWRSALWSRLPMLPPCAEAFEATLLTMQITGDAVTLAALTVGEIALTETSSAYEERIDLARDRLAQLMEALQGADAESPPAGNWRQCTNRDLDLIYDDAMKSSELFLSAYQIENVAGLANYMRNQFEWRDRLWLALPGCAEIFDFFLRLVQTVGDYASSISFDFAGVSPQANPYPEEISRSHEHISEWAEAVWPVPSAYVTPSAAELRTYYVDNAGRAAALHSCASYDCDIEALALHGEALGVVDDSSEWFQVDLGIGLDLYVHSSLMSATAPGS